MTAMAESRRRETRPRRLTFYAVISVVGIAASAAWARQWREEVALRARVEQAKLDVNELEGLRAENARLRERQIPAAELERLRADHAALPRLRAELEAVVSKSDSVSRR